MARWRSGRHRFCHREKRKDECGTFGFAIVWRKTGAENAHPLLVLFGGKHHVVPVEANRQRLQTLLAKTGVRTEYASLNRFDPEYFKMLAAYLERTAKP